MGMVQAEITLKNIYDVIDFDRKRIEEHEVRQATVTAIVDTGAMYMIIPEELSQKLGLVATKEKTAYIANGQRINCKMVEVVGVQWKDRETITHALIIPGSEKVLLSAIALEGMDLMVDPVNQELVGVHGDKMEILIL